MWDLIVSVPDHCLSFYFETVAKFTLHSVVQRNTGSYMNFEDIYDKK